MEIDAAKQAAKDTVGGAPSNKKNDQERIIRKGRKGNEWIGFEMRDLRPSVRRRYAIDCLFMIPRR